MRAGDLTKLASFQRPEKGRDADGNPILSYIEDFRAWVHVRPLRGGESVMAARMQSRTPAIVMFRASAASRLATSEWRVVIDGRTYEGREDPRESEDRAFFEMLVEAGNG